MPWSTATMTVRIKPTNGPNANVVLKIGISAGSYSRNGRNIGMWIIATSMTDKAAMTAIEVMLRVVNRDFERVFMR